MGTKVQRAKTMNTAKSTAKKKLAHFRKPPKDYTISSEEEHIEKNRLDEAMTAYLPTLPAYVPQAPSDKKLQKKAAYDDFFANKMLLTSAIKKGIPYSLFREIQQNSPFSEIEWADFIGISTKSLHRYKTALDHYFKSVHSEKIIEMAEVISVGLDVFGDMDKLKLWLITPNFALGESKPLELLKDSYGKELVLSALIRINHGIFI